MLYYRDYATYVEYVRILAIEKIMAWELIWDIRRRYEVDVGKLF
jgi:hypothetical protein